MILGMRSIAGQPIHGINIFVTRDWLLPIDELGLRCFHSFDEIFFRLKNDPEATQFAIKGIDDKILTRLNTATLAAERSLPERVRSSSQLWSIALSENHLWCRLPGWAQIAIEKASGTWEKLNTTQTSSGSWTKIPLTKNDIKAHVILLNSKPQLSLNSNEDARFYRMAEIIENKERGLSLPQVSLSLNTKEFIKDLERFVE